MDARRFDDIEVFRERTRALLMLDEARHNLMLGITTTLIEQPNAYSTFHAWVVTEGDLVVGAALMTPPFFLVVARPIADGALAVLADAVHRDAGVIPGITAALPEAETFSDAWERLTGARRRRRMTQLIYRLSAVQPVPVPPGRLRRARFTDRDTLVQWLGAFSDEAGALPVRDLEDMVGRRLRETDDGFFLWEDGTAASLVGCGGRTPSGVRIGPVYTPPRRRGRGYATAAVAEMSASLLERGSTFCFLYTDARNATSNHIYRTIGYEPVCESVMNAYDVANP